jgi:hypothetical protein
VTDGIVARNGNLQAAAKDPKAGRVQVLVGTGELIG